MNQSAALTYKAFVKLLKNRVDQVAIGNSVRIVDSALGKGSRSRGSLEVRLNAI